MARIAEKVSGTAQVDRVVSMPGWVYNAFVERAKAQRRPVKYQIEVELEKIAQEWKKEQPATT